MGSVYRECMPVRTITIDVEAYDRLARLKRSGQSFSQVIKEHLPAHDSTAGDLLARLNRTAVSDETLANIERVIDARDRHPVRIPEW
jgi:predicted CopG family antitoxin